jgi:3-oxoacyl-[acyl-carrier-protein] synthase II
MQQVIREGPARANPSLFPGSVMNVAASQVSMLLGLRGYNTTLNHRQISGELAALLAADALRLGRAPALLCGGVDELTRAVHHGHRRLAALAAGAPRPYGAGRDGVVLGEGAAVLCLERAAGALARGARVLARVAGVGSAGGPDAPARALRLALEQAGLEPGDVDLVLGCGGGHPLLDRQEALAISEVLGPDVPLTSPHGTLGSWMAAGALRLVAAVQCLQQAAIFPTVMASEADPGLPTGGLVTRPREAPLRAVLVSGQATGGSSAAVLLTGGQG